MILDNNPSLKDLFGGEIQFLALELNPRCFLARFINQLVKKFPAFMEIEGSLLALDPLQSQMNLVHTVTPYFSSNPPSF
jgi:hypothetical protein